MRPDLYRLFGNLSKEEQREWAEIVQLPAFEYAARLLEKAEAAGYSQQEKDEAVAWTGNAGNIEVLFFRVPDPGDLAVVQRMYALVEETNSPIAFAFVNQRPDGVDTWDIFLLSRLSYLCHCNRISGPGSECEQ